MGPSQYGWTTSPAPQWQDTRATDRSALNDVFIAVVLGLVAVFISVGWLFASPALSVLTASTSASGTTISVAQSGLVLILILIGISAALELVQLWLYRRAFVTLARVDDQFSTPSKLVLVLLIALVFLILAVIGIFYELAQAVSCAGAGNPIPASCIDGGAVLGLLGLLLVFGIAALVGFFGGLILGIWRLGTRYNDGLFKAGAILTIFPVLNIIGTILILVATHRAREVIARSGAPSSFG